ncbi:MAG: hypothetical protein KA436_06265, partial [Oligoflexales bacterium]|nr:hypothetical protein [Oligoflexales bacterium]
SGRLPRECSTWNIVERGSQADFRENVPRGTSWNINLARRGFGKLHSWFPYKLFGRECSTWNIVEQLLIL